jgi:hypothetical protein
MENNYKIEREIDYNNWLQEYDYYTNKDIEIKVNDLDIDLLDVDECVMERIIKDMNIEFIDNPSWLKRINLHNSINVYISKLPENKVLEIINIIRNIIKEEIESI